MNKYIVNHSLLTNIGAILFCCGVFGSMIFTAITHDRDMGLFIFLFGILGGVLVNFGVVNES